MNIVFLSPESVYPANTGGRIVVYNKIKYLSKLGYNVALFCVVDSEEEISLQEKEMEKYCSFMRFYNRKNGGVEKYIKTISKPYAVASRTIKQITVDLENYIYANKCDIIWCEMPQMAGNLLKKIRIYNDIKMILSQQNIEFLSMRSLARDIKNPIKKLVYLVEAYKFFLFEQKLYKSNLFDSYVFVSENDMLFFKKQFNYFDKPLELIPIGADDHGDAQKKPSKNVLIVGKMSYLPNVEGVLWFYEKVWRGVYSQIKDAHLFVVGKDPDERLRDINDPTVTVTGTVESIEPYYQNAAVAVIPLFSGGGVKTKLIEASSFKVPIVCTSSGASGTSFQNEKHIFISDDPDDFSGKVCACLVGNKDIGERANRAYDMFKELYTWEGIIKRLDHYLNELIKLS